MKTIFKIIAAACLVLGANAYADNAGLSLAQKNACLSCHSADNKIVGPAYKDVANKYRDKAYLKQMGYKDTKAVEAYLVDKVQKGGSGVWGAIPMPPNPQVKEEDLRVIVKWVLSLK
ncbi:MAG: c-type cytochrome [Sulfuriferula sp.]